MSAKSLVLCLALVSYAIGQDITYQLSSDTVVEITCTYSSGCDETDIHIKAEPGYKALITVKSVNIDGTNGDYLLIKSGYRDDDGLTGRIFTHYIKNEREYVSLTEEILVRFVVQDRDDDAEITGYEGFSLTVEQYGEQETTVAPVITDKPWPTPSEEDYITVNITVTNIENTTIDDFIHYIASLTDVFLENSDFELSEAFSEDNVRIGVEKGCPAEWPNSATCTQVGFAIPILLAENSKYNDTYQLNSTYLLKIWESSVDHHHPNFSIYDPEEHRGVVYIWIAIISGTVLLWGVVYLGSGYGWTGYILRRKKKEAEEKNLSEGDQSKRESINSLSPHPLQHMPKFFDADVIYYNPDSPTVAVRNSSGRTDHHDDPRDTLDASNLNLRTFSFNGQDVDDVTET